MADAKLAGQIVRMRQRRTGPLILELDLTDGIADGPPQDPVAALLTIRRTRLPDLLDGLKRAASDDRVRALVVKVGGSRIGLAKVQELRDAVLDFRQSGKLAVAWSESFGDFVRGNVPYYLATGFDRIYLQPSGTLGPHRDRGRAGLPARRARAARHRFPVRQAVRVQVGRRPADRDRVHRPGPGGGRPARRVGHRAAGGGDRGRPRADRRAGAGAARARAVPRPAGPVRGAGGRAALPRPGLRAGPQGGRAPTRRCSTCSATGARTRIGDLPRRLGSGVRELTPGQPERFVAMIYAHGAIRQGRSGRGGPGGGGMGSDTVAAALRAAAADEGARAVVLRVNSPGGSARRVRRDLARGGPGPRGGQAGGRVDGRRGRLGRVLHLRARPT